MELSHNYNVEIGGEILDGFELAQVREAAARLFKVSPEKADLLIASKRVVKKDLDHQSAQIYRRKLESIGLVVQLQPLAPPEPESGLMSLSLEPLEDEPPPAPQDKVQPPTEALAFSCPKCGVEQARSEQCTGCGVFFHKLEQAAPAVAEVTEEEDAFSTEDDELEEHDGVEDRIDLKAIGAGAGVALLGALLWKFIAVMFGYELGLVAWLIGGAVGFTVAALGARGQLVGIICGVLTVLAIFGGKYMAIDSLQSEWSELFSSSEFEEIYQQEMVVAQLYAAEVSDESSLRQFIADYEYGEVYEADEVTPEMLAEFNEISKPRLEWMSAQTRSFEDWQTFVFEDQIQDLSTFELIKEDFGFIDLIFLFLGVGTAFRLGYGQEE